MFEVGKHYKEPCSSDSYECKFVGKAYSILYRASCNHEIVTLNCNSWKEYIPPKPVCKFKIGDTVSFKGVTNPLKVTDTHWNGYQYILTLENNGHYNEDILEICKPLTFADLKAGEKFKWAIKRGHEDTICLKCRGVNLNCTTHLYTTLNGPIVGHTFGNSNDDIPANEVIRAE